MKDLEARQLEMATINDWVGKDHPYRRLRELLDFDKISKSAKAEETHREQSDMEKAV